MLFSSQFTQSLMQKRTLEILVEKAVLSHSITTS
jgi:hypothetical protein